MLLRIAIGWHFSTEAMQKVDPPKGKEFSAEGYFRASQGPFAPQFRALIPDADGTETLRLDDQGLPVALKERWDADFKTAGAHYNFDADQKSKAEEALTKAKATADAWFRDRENAWRVRRYVHDLQETKATERDPNALAADKEWVAKGRKKLEAERKDLMALVNGWSTDLHAAWEGVATDSQKAAGPVEPTRTRLDWLNLLTKWGMLAAGVCLLVGLFTPVAALWCAAFLAMIYLSTPPWPGLPPAPIAEGNYWIVNKNLVELLACLVVATTPNGQWLGLDALLFGWRHRRRLARELARDDLADDGDDFYPRSTSLKPGPLARSDRR